MPFSAPAGLMVQDLPLKMIERPERFCSSEEAWLVDKDRLFSVLEAMITGHPLPPIQVHMWHLPGTYRLQQTFLN